MLEEIVRQEVESLVNKEETLAVAIVGSYARSQDTDHNDIDFFIIVDGSWRKWDTKIIDGVVVERFFNSMGWSKWYLHNEDWWSHYWWYKNADVRYDPNDLFEELKEHAETQKNHSFPSNSELNQALIRYSLWDRQKDLENASELQYHYLLNDFFDYLVRVLFLINNEAPVKKNFRISRLNTIDDEASDAVERFLKADDLGDREDAIDNLIDLVTDYVGGPSPEIEVPKQEYHER